MTQAPKAKQIAHTLRAHDHERIDPYYWLNDREDPEVIDYLKAENAYLASSLAHTDDFRERLFQEITGRIKQTDLSVPYRKNGFYYYVRFEEGQEYPIYARKENLESSTEELLLNGNERATGHPFYQTSSLSVSPNNKLLGFGEDVTGRRLYTLRFKNLETGELYPEEITGTAGQVAWANNNSTVFYTIKDEETLRENRIYRHELGTDPSEDVLVYEETDDTFVAFVYRSKSGRFILIGSSSTLTTECRYIEADSPQDEFQPVLPRERGHEYSPTHYGDHFYLLSNRDAQNFKLVRFPVGNPEQLETVIEHRPTVLLEDVELFSKYMVITERENGLLNLRIIPWDGSQEHYVPFDEATYTAWLSVNREFDSEWLRFGYTSLTTPSSTYDYHMGTRERKLMKQQEVVGDFDAANYEAERVHATASDGTQVPISLVYRKGFERTGKHPLLLYGYGSYGASMDPYFGQARLSLLDRGFVFAIAHIRGGEDLGRPWYEAGKLLQKKNTFTDFIACGDFLVEQGYADPKRLFGMGGSAGGLLIGAVANLRPELFRALVAQVPFVDVVTTMLDESIPLTTGEYDEWGDPREKAYYDYMLSYSPYDNVSNQAYPAMLITTGLHDSQVQYWEPAKWVARLREKGTGSAPILMYTNMDAGHGGSSGRLEQYREVALEYAFLLDQAGISE